MGMIAPAQDQPRQVGSPPLARVPRWRLDRGGRQIAGGHGTPSQSDTSLGRAQRIELSWFTWNVLLCHRDPAHLLPR